MLQGLVASNAGESYWSEKSRRSIFHQYPQGAAPLMGLLSLMDDMEVDKPKFGWWEERFEQWATTTIANTTGTFGTDADPAVDKSSPFTSAVGAALSVKVTDRTKFRERDVIEVLDVPTSTSGVYERVVGVVESIRSSTGNTGWLILKLTKAATACLNTAATVGLNLQLVGSASGEAVRSKSGNLWRPIEIENYTQIFRNAFSLSRNAMKAGLRYDSSGEHKEKAHKAALRHSIMIERAMFSGERYTDTVTNEDGDTVPRRFMGGLHWYLRQWELGNTDNGGAFDYRPGGSDVTASNWATNDDKRICNVHGTMTTSQWNNIIERLFRYTNDTSYEKLAFCGGKFLQAFSEFVDSSTLVHRKLFETGKGGFSCYEWESPFGSVFFKTHPLFNEQSDLRNSCYFLDLADFTYVYLQDSDTELLTNRQNNDADLRKDEWMTECSLAIKFPEQNLILHNVTGITS